MANKIQSIRTVYDVAKNAREAHNPLDDETIKMLLKNTVNDSEYESKYNRFERGYAAEDLFMFIYSKLPWVKLITPLGQEQFPEISKEVYQVSDYEVSFICGSRNEIKQCLVEVKLVDGDKQTYKIKKSQYDVLKNYAESRSDELLFALFWYKKMTWTLIPIDVFEEKSSCYKIDFDTANENDISAIFGDYSYVFSEKCYRKSKYDNNAETCKYFHTHEIYGRTVYDGISVDGDNYDEMQFFYTPVLDVAFDFKEINHYTDENKVTTLIEQLDKTPYSYRLSSLIIAYLFKIFCYDKESMYTEKNTVSDSAFKTIDTVRRYMGGERYYLIPKIINNTTTQLLKRQFGECDWIMDIYYMNLNEPKKVILAPHNKL